MKVYSVTGWRFEEAESGRGAAYFRTKAEALAAARDQTAPDADGDGGSEAQVSVDHIDRVDAARVVALLNGGGWCDRSEVIAVVRNGRVVHAAAPEASR